MAVVIITADEPQHRYVANAICASSSVAAIFVCRPSARRSPWTMLRRSPARFFDKALRAVFLTAIGDRTARRAQLDAILGAQGREFARPDLVVPVGSPKDPELAAQIKLINPEIIAVYGTGVVPDAVLGLAGTLSLNLHTGLSPWYRGVACAFWPIVDRQPGTVGATVHECTSAVDGGCIYARQQVVVRRGDGLHAIFARAVVAGADIYAHVINRALAAPIQGERQDLTLGKEFKGAMLGFWPEVRARWNLWRMQPRLDRLDDIAADATRS